jgi:hypothetical protein
MALPPAPPAALPPAALALPPLALDLAPDVDLAAALDCDSDLLLDADPLMAAELAALFPSFFGPLLFPLVFPPFPVASAWPENKVAQMIRTSLFMVFPLSGKW